MNGLRNILFDQKTIDGRVKELAADISRDYQGKDLVLVGILKGAVIFLADLMRALTVPAEIDFVHASSYGKGTESSGAIVVKKDIEAEFRGRHVLLVDCIIDTGETLDFLMKRYRQSGPASLEAVVLLDKISRRTRPVPVKYRGFEIPDEFVVGYGLDVGQKFRCLPHIAVVAVRTG